MESLKGEGTEGGFLKVVSNKKLLLRQQGLCKEPLPPGRGGHVSTPNRMRRKCISGSTKKQISRTGGKAGERVTFIPSFLPASIL